MIDRRRFLTLVTARSTTSFSLQATLTTDARSGASPCAFYCTDYQRRSPKAKWHGRTVLPRFGWKPLAVTRDRDKNLDLTSENVKYVKELVEDAYSASESPLKDAPGPRGKWTEKPFTIRAGVLAMKIGVVPQWTVSGQKILCTMLQVLDNHVIDYKPPEEFAKMESCHRLRWKNRYGLCIVGALSCDPNEMNEKYNALFTEAGVAPKRRLTKFLVTPNAALQVGTPVTALHFRPGDYVDVQSRTIDHGFQGVIKRWGMKGGRASHGVTKAHRRMGSIGGGRDKGGVWRGKKMPGHMGNDWRYVRGLKVMRINTKYNVLYVKGDVPGNNHGFVRVLDTVLPLKRKQLSTNPPPMPTFLPDDLPQLMASLGISDQVLPDDWLDKQLYSFESDSLTFPEKAQAGAIAKK